MPDMRVPQEESSGALHVVGLDEAIAALNIEYPDGSHASWEMAGGKLSIKIVQTAVPQRAPGGRHER